MALTIRNDTTVPFGTVSPSNTALLSDLQPNATQALEAFIKASLTPGKFLLSPADLVAALSDKRSTRVVTINMHHLSVYAHDAAFRACLNGADFWCADGRPVVQALLNAGLTGVQRVTGADLCNDLGRFGIIAGLEKVAILGSTDAVVAAYRGRLAAAGRTVVFSDTGHRDQWTQGNLEDALTAANPDVILLAVGTPHGDFVTQRLTAFTNCPVIVVGAGLAMAVGAERRAPLLVQRVGLEWLWRLAGNPVRLWRRYALQVIPTLRPLNQAVARVAASHVASSPAAVPALTGAGIPAPRQAQNEPAIPAVDA